MRQALAATALIWKMVAFKFAMFSLLTLWNSWRGVSHGVDLGHVSPQVLSELIGDAFASWAITMVAFVDQSIQRTRQDQKEKLNEDKANGGDSDGGAGVAGR